MSNRDVNKKLILEGQIYLEFFRNLTPAILFGSLGIFSFWAVKQQVDIFQEVIFIFSGCAAIGISFVIFIMNMTVAYFKFKELGRLHYLAFFFMSFLSLMTIVLISLTSAINYIKIFKL